MFFFFQYRLRSAMIPMAAIEETRDIEGTDMLLSLSSLTEYTTKFCLSIEVSIGVAITRAALNPVKFPIDSYRLGPLAR